MKTRTNQPVFLDNGQLVDDNNLGGGTQLYKHTFTATLVNMVTSDTISISPTGFYYADTDSSNPSLSNLFDKLNKALVLKGTVSISGNVYSIIAIDSTSMRLLALAGGTMVNFPLALKTASSSLTGAETRPL